MDLKNNPYYVKAQAFIAATDLHALETGKHVLDEGNLWVNIVETTLRAEGTLETHDAFIDIQIPLSGAEGFGIKPRSACKEEKAPYNPEKDITFYLDKPDEIVTVQAGEQITFCPDQAHAPLVGEAGAPIRKAIFKVRVA